MDLDTELAALSAGPTPAAAMARVDAALASVNGRSLIPASEVTDWLLDIRLGLALTNLTLKEN